MCGSNSVLRGAVVSEKFQKFLLWSHLKTRAYAVRVRNVEHLQERFDTAYSDIASQTIHAVLLDRQNKPFVDLRWRQWWNIF
jgi:hypothetical protein